MENTVETLLLHGDGSPEELIRKLPTLTPGVPNANNAANNNNQGRIDQDAELARQLAAAEEHAVANNINRRSRPVAGGVPPQRRMMETTPNWFVNGSENTQYQYSNDELLLLDRMNGVSFDNEHDYQMSQLKSLKDRGLSYKRKRMEMRSEFEAFLAQSLG